MPTSDRFALLDLLPSTDGWRRQLAADRAGGAPRPVVLAFVPSAVADDAARLAALVRDVELAARVHHPAVVPVLGLETVSDALAVVTGWREGATVRELLDAAGRLPPDLAARIVRDAAAGVHEAHVHAGDGEPLVHGGIDARAILVASDGAVAVDGFCTAPSGTAAGDVRALVAVLYECLTGEAPPPGGAIEAPGVPAALVALLQRSLREGRPPATADALRAALEGMGPLASADAVAAYAEAILPPPSEETVARRGTLEVALGPSPAASAGAPADAGERGDALEEISEDLIVGDGTPAPFDVPVVTPYPAPTPAAAAPPRAPTPVPSAATPRSWVAPAAASIPGVAQSPEERARAVIAAARSASLSDVEPTPVAIAPPRTAASGEPAGTFPLPRDATARGTGRGSRVAITVAVAAICGALGVAGGFAASRLRIVAREPGGTSAGDGAPVARRSAPSAKVAEVPAAPSLEPVREADAPAAPAAAAAARAEPPPPTTDPARRAPAPSLAISAEPVADVVVDGRRAGRAPVTVAVARGEHEVRLLDPARGIDVRRKVVARGPATPVRFSLGKGKLDVTAPDEAEVLVDGRRIGKGTLHAEIYEGAHRIEVRLGQARASERFRIAPGETWTYAVSPTP